MLQDSLGRTFRYLRLSITDKCNFRCLYCLPKGYQAPNKVEPFLSVDEIRRLVIALSQFGFYKIRLTGGEPTLRRDFLAIATEITSIPHVQKVMLSTNGYRLLQEYTHYATAGIQGLNVSLDSLQVHKFKHLTGHDKLDDILLGLQKASELGIFSIKTNTVLMQGINDDEIPAFIDWVRDKSISARFIELMPTGLNQHTFQNYHMRVHDLKTYLQQTGWREKPRAFDAGPALEFTHPDFVGTIGLIAPYAHNFCASCNRLRMTSFGELKLCLFGEKKYSLRHLLQQDTQITELQETLATLLLQKKHTHALHVGDFGNVAHFAAMGG